jgi:transposase
MRDLLVRQRTAAINEVRAFCRRHGLRLPKCAAAKVPKHARLLLLDSPLWDVCEPLWVTLRALNEQIAVREKKLAQLAIQDPQVQRL